MCLSGIGHIAALWLRALTGTALTDGLWGTAYLVTGIGLFGQSRFSLVMAVVIPVAATSVLFYTVPRPEAAYTLRMAIDAAVVLLCAIVLWQTRHHPGV